LFASLRGTVAVAFSPLALLAFGTAMLLGLSGGSARVDDVVWAEVRSVSAGWRRASPPRVIGFDAQTLQAFGPPPWGASTWATFGADLARQGITDVQLVDRWDRWFLEKDGVPTGIRWHVPAVGLDGSEGPKIPDGWGDAVVVEAVSTALPRTPIVEDVEAASRAGSGSWLPHLACVSGVGCTPQARIPLTGRAVSVVGLDVLADASAGFLPASSTEPMPLAGVVDPAHASLRWTYGRSTARAEVELVADAVASGRAGVAAYPLRGAALAAWLLMLHLAVSAIGRRGQPSRWLVLGPLVAMSAAIVGSALAGLEAPIVAGILASASSPIALMSIRAARATSELQRLELLVLRAASRAGLLRRRLQDVAEVSEALVAASTLHAPGCGTFWMRPVEGELGLGGWEVVSGPGLLEASTLHPLLVSVRHPEVRACLSTRRATPVRGLRADGGGTVLLLPLAQGSRILGLWGVVGEDPASLPDGAALGVVATALGERIALGVVFASLRASEGLAEDEAEQLFVAVDEERRRWMIVLRGLLHPAMAADTTGFANLTNPAMQRALTAAGLGGAKTVQDLVAALAPPETARRMLRDLFADGRPITLPWPDLSLGPRTLVIRPVGGREGEGGPSLGWLASLETGAQVVEASLPELDDATSDVREPLVEPPVHLVPDAVGR
jgi:hypothetical protein